jgi:hypothetical protein
MAKKQLINKQELNKRIAADRFNQIRNELVGRPRWGSQLSAVVVRQSQRLSQNLSMDRAFSPFLFGCFIPGALPQEVIATGNRGLKARSITSFEIASPDPSDAQE